jgi:hypothetical protein
VAAWGRVRGGLSWRRLREEVWEKEQSGLVNLRARGQAHLTRLALYVLSEISRRGHRAHEYLLSNWLNILRDT